MTDNELVAVMLNGNKIVAPGIYTYWNLLKVVGMLKIKGKEKQKKKAVHKEKEKKKWSFIFYYLNLVDICLILPMD